MVKNVENYFRYEIVPLLVNGKYIGRAYLLLLAIGAILSLLIVGPYDFGLTIGVWIVGVILITLAFLYLKRYYLDLKNINDSAKIIAQGDYNYKIDETQTVFKDIAHSFNAIGDNLNEAVEKEVKSERLKSELITNVSHDLKTPLTSIINYSELIVSEKDKKKQKEYAKIINDKSLKLKILIEDLFDLSKVTSGNVELSLEEIDFTQLLNQIIGEWTDKFEEKELDINLKFEESINLMLDGNKTSRIFDNLFSNIYKYAMPGTRVYVDLEKKENIRLTIKNISKHPLNISEDEIMERFTRGDSARNTEGSGLGLSIARSLTEAQGGSFNIEIDGDLFKTVIIF